LKGGIEIARNAVGFITAKVKLYNEPTYDLTMKYTIILEREEEGGYSAQCLELPGAISQGESKEEAIKNVKEAIEAVLEVLNQEVKGLRDVAEISKVEVSA
jgi:predicted RNase H-like HicB family nuclease